MSFSTLRGELNRTHPSMFSRPSLTVFEQVNEQTHELINVASISPTLVYCLPLQLSISLVTKDSLQLWLIPIVHACACIYNVYGVCVRAVEICTYVTYPYMKTQLALLACLHMYTCRPA